MQAKLKKVGEELALVLDHQTWKASGIDGETELEVDVDESGIHIRPRSEDRQERLMASARRMMDVHEETFRKLAR